MDESSKILDTSYAGLRNQPKRKNKRGKLTPLKSEENQVSIVQWNSRDDSPTKLGKSKPIPPGYELASYEKAMLHWNKMSYTKKIINLNGEEEYGTFSIFDDVSDLKQYGLGIYFYMQFIKRLTLTCFVITVLYILPLFLNYTDDGLKSYKPSFALTLAKLTLGNLSDADQRTYIMESACVVLAMLTLFGFYMNWRSFHFETLEGEEKSLAELDPTMYALSVVGFDPKTPNLEEQLQSYFDTIYRGAYQVQVVHNFKRNFKMFEQLEEIIQKVAKQKQIINQSDKSNEDLIKFQQQLKEKQDQVSKVAIQFDPIYAIIHFRNLKSRYAFINVCRKYSLFNSAGFKFKRWFCCMPGLPERLKFNKKDNILIESVNLPQPDGIAWNNVDITGPSYAGRFVLSIVFIAISIFITSSCIALLTLYVTTSSNCGSFDDKTTIDQVIAAGDKLTTYCFCSANYVSIYTNDKIGSLCSTIQTDILITNIVQIAASLLSTVTNILLIVVVSLIAQKLLKPDYKPKEYNFVFVSVFLSNLINSTILPLILNSDIFGFKSVSYLTFIDFINFTKVSIFSDFDLNWFAVISPYYTNFFIIASISPLIQLIVYALKRKIVDWKLKKQCENNDPSDPTIQKEADKIVEMFPFDFPTELAVLCLQFFMCFMYSILIPLAIPIFTLGLLLTFFCKRYIILNYTIRVPANESLNQKVITLIPFILLVQGLIGIWGRTVDGVFDESAFFKLIDPNMFDNIILQRAIKDIVLLGATALVLLWIIFDFTILRFFRFLCDLCKNQLELPVAFAAIENTNYADRLRKSNILGSYKLSNHPVFKHPYNAYRRLMKEMQMQKKYEQEEPKLKQSVALETIPSLGFAKTESNIIPKAQQNPVGVNPYQPEQYNTGQTNPTNPGNTQLRQSQQPFNKDSMRGSGNMAVHSMRRTQQMQKEERDAVQSPKLSQRKQEIAHHEDNKDSIESLKIQHKASGRMKKQVEVEVESSHELSLNQSQGNQALINNYSNSNDNIGSEPFLKLNSMGEE